MSGECDCGEDTCVCLYPNDDDDFYDYEENDYNDD